MIEQLYSDFTNKLLPQLQSGLTITKDYFVDLFGRYIKYLITVNSIGVGIGLIFLISGIISLVKYIKYGNKLKWDGYRYDSLSLLWLIPFILLLLGALVFGLNLDSLIKDIYIPEVRIFEIIKNYN